MYTSSLSLAKIYQTVAILGFAISLIATCW